MPRAARKTKSIRFSESEIEEITAFTRASGDLESTLLHRAAIRGLREERLDRAILAYIRGASSGEAAILAGLPRARLLHELADHGVMTLEDDHHRDADLAGIAERWGDPVLANIIRDIAGEAGGSAPPAGR